MRKVTWTVLGLAGLSLLLCGTDEEVLAQTDTGAARVDTELRQTVLQLQGELAQVRQELAQVRQELDALAVGTGVGGSGQGGGTPAGAPRQDANRTGASEPLRAGTAQETRGSARDTSNAGEAVVNAIYTGTVRSVSDGQLVLVDEGEPLTLRLGDRTRVYQNGQSISARQLKAGTRVRVTVDLVGRGDQVTEITTLPAAR
jgi:hypothetical protein